MFKVDEIKNRDVWDSHVFEFSNDGFIQSWRWGESKKKNGKKIFRIGVFSGDDNLVLTALITKETIWKDFTMLYLARGPILKTGLELREYEEVWKVFLDYIDELAKKERVVFFKMEPWNKFPDSKSECRGCNCLGLLKSDWTLQPQESLLLDIKKSEEKLLKSMKSKTRYNIRLSEKKGVKVEETSDINRFWKLAQVTALRDGFGLHEKSYYESLLEEGGLSCFIARRDQEDLAAVMVGFSEKRAIYLHGASSNEKRELMATYLIQWRAIQEAIKRGCSFYDFWGVAPLAIKGGKWKIKDKNHGWAGVTRFKLGFVPGENAGIYEEYPGAWDKIYNNFWYKILNLARKVKNL